MRSKRRNQKEYRIHFKFFLALNLFSWIQLFKKEFAKKRLELSTTRPPLRKIISILLLLFFTKCLYQNIFASHFGQLAIIFLWTF